MTIKTVRDLRRLLDSYADFLEVRVAVPGLRGHHTVHELKGLTLDDDLDRGGFNLYLVPGKVVGVIPDEVSEKATNE